MESTVVRTALLLSAAASAGVGLAGLTVRLPRHRLVGLRIDAVPPDDE